MDSIQRKEIVTRFVKFCLVAGIGFVIQAGTLLLLTEVFGLWYLFSFILGVVLATLWNFTGHLRWTFRAENKKKAGK